MTTILFDLDGTLVDTTSVVLPCFRDVLVAHEASIPSDDVLRRTYGLPDEQIWAQLLPDAPADERTTAFAYMEKLVAERMFHADLLMPHARDVLDQLVARGYTLTTASNCGQAYLDALLDSQQIRDVFTHPLCLGSVRGTRKADILSAHFRRFDAASAVMVGDRASDLEAAAVHDVPAIGCTFGFGTRAELSGAVRLIDDLRQLLEIFPGHGEVSL